MKNEGVALTPLIAIQIMGIVYRIKTRGDDKNAAAELTTAFNPNEILEFEEEY
nr:hypothetical protein [Clostridia bacterium]